MPEQRDNNRFKAIDFFCGGGGMTRTSIFVNTKMSLDIKRK